MRSYLLPLLCAAAFASKVKVLTESNFDETLAENENVLVEFYAPWCGHCKRLAPEYDAASLKLEGENVVLGKVDATEESELASKFEVRGYPTLIWFKNGKTKEYDGGRTADTIVSWIKKKIGPVLTLIESAEQAEKFKESSECVVIASVAESDIDTLKAVAEDMDEPFAYITDADLAKELEVSGVVVFKDFDEGKATYDGEITEAGLKKFVGGESIPLVMTWQDNQDKMSKLDAPLLFAAHEADAEATTEGLKAAAAEYKGQFLFYTVDTKVGPNSRLLDFFGVKAGETVVFQQADRKKFFHRDSMETLPSFLKSVVDGEAKPEFKSEEPPADNDGPVKVVVGKEFEKIVLDKTKNVMIEFYAPWCGHCKKLAPIYEKLGKHYGDNDDVVIAKMDSTANEVESPSVSGFPTIYFYPAGTTEGMKYEGDRALDDFIEFIDENSTKAASASSSKKAEGHDEL